MKKLITLCLFLTTTALAAKTSPDLILQENNGVISVITNNTIWRQVPPATAQVERVYRQGQNLIVEIVEAGHQLTASWKVSGEEIYLRLMANENSYFSYPWPFVREKADSTENLLIPVAEGISYPAHDQSIKPYDWLKGNTGYGLSLPLFGVYNDAGDGYGFFTTTPDYFELKVDWQNQWLLTPRWSPGKTNFGERVCYFKFFPENSLVEIAKWYRNYLKKIGYLISLNKKNSKHLQGKDLVAVPHLWIWDDPEKVADFLQSYGINPVLLANCDPQKDWDITKEKILRIHKTGYLTGKYANWEDCWPPELKGITEYTQGWPDGLIKNRAGEHLNAWTLYGSDGKPYIGAKLCSAYIRKLVAKSLPDYLKHYPLNSFFVDIMTGQELEECYAQEHSQDRIVDRLNKMAILKTCSRLTLTGSEKMTWWGIPVCHYSMGILSLNPYPPADDIGANPTKILDRVSSDYLLFDVGPKYRVPFFELVAHDCVLPTWYWGDGNNKHPATWREKDIFTVLYGGTPMWCFASLNELQQYADSLKSSYDFVQPILTAIGAAEMINFRYLNQARTIQQSEWANGVRVTVNFQNLTVIVNNPNSPSQP